VADTTQTILPQSSGSILGDIQSLLLYGGTSYIDKHTSYRNEPAPQAQPVDQQQTQTQQGTGSPNSSGVIDAVRKNQQTLLLGFGGLLLAAVVIKAFA